MNHLPLSVLLFLSIFCSLISALSHAQEKHDAYTLWQQGHSNEAIPLLEQEAREQGSWQAYYNLGLAAHDADKTGQAIAAFLQARQLAPLQADPQQALRILLEENNLSPLTPTYSYSFGPLAFLGQGQLGFILLSITSILFGLSFGIGLVRKIHESRQKNESSISAFSSPVISASSQRKKSKLARRLFLIALLLSFISGPGLVCLILDQSVRYVVNHNESSLLNSTGKPQKTLPAGSIFLLRSNSGGTTRIHVEDLPDPENPGLTRQSGFIPAGDAHIIY